MAVFVEARRTPVDAEVRDAVLAAARLCQTLGHTVDPIPCPSTGVVTATFALLGHPVGEVTARPRLPWHFRRSEARALEPPDSPRLRGARLRTIAAIWRLRRFSRAFAR